MKWIGLMIYPFFVLTSPAEVKGQKELTTAYNQALNLEFEKSRLTLESIPESDSAYFKLYIENLNDILHLVFSENEVLYDSLAPNEKTRLSILKESPEDTPLRLFYMAEIRLQWAFVKLKFGKQWSAAWALRKAYKTIKKNIAKHPNFDLNSKTLGLLHVIFGAVPPKYQWLIGILGLEGNVNLGLDELSSLSDHSSRIFSRESRLISALVYSYLLEDHKGSIELLQLGVSNSLTETYISSLILLKAHRAIEARNTILKTNSQQPLFQYLLGETYFLEGHYTEANRYYGQFLNSFQGINNIKDAHFKRSLGFLFLGDQNSYQAEKEKAIRLGKEFSEVDKNAQELVNQSNSHFQILQLRYGIDGGFFQKADSLLNKINISQLDDNQLRELTYRKARLHHLKGTVELAKQQYLKIAYSEKQLYNYFVPNSMLQLGYIYMQSSEFDKAKEQFKMVLKSKRHTYKNSLDSKARIALERISSIDAIDH